MHEGFRKFVVLILNMHIEQPVGCSLDTCNNMPPGYKMPLKSLNR